MTYTLMLLTVCVLGHPDRCADYSLAFDGPSTACALAAGQFLAGRPYLVPGGGAVCREEAET